MVTIGLNSDWGNCQFHGIDAHGDPGLLCYFARYSCFFEAAKIFDKMGFSIEKKGLSHRFFLSVLQKYLLNILSINLSYYFRFLALDYTQL